MMTQEEWPRFQECKLHLTISLDGSDVSHACMVTAQKFPMNVCISATVMPVVPAESMEESYMIMNSAHTTLSNGGCAPQSIA